MSQSSRRDFQLSTKKQKLLQSMRQQMGLDSAARPTIPRRAAGAALPLSFAQERMWFLAQLEPDNVAYNNGAAVRLTGDLDVGVLEKAIRQIIDRHEILRTTFAVSGGQPMQVIAAEPDFSLPIRDLSGVAPEAQPRQIAGLATEQLRQPFDLNRGPLLRALLLRTAEDRHVLILVMHHIICDGWSKGILLRELAAYYSALLAGQPAQLPELSVQYADFAAWQRAWLRGENLAAHLDYWKARLKGPLPVLELMTDRPRPAVESFRGAVARFTADRDLTQALKDLGQQTGATLFMTLLAAFDVLLLRYTGQHDILIGSPIANRNYSEIEPLMGYFANTVVLRIGAHPDQTFKQLLGHVKQTTLDAYAHQDLPFEKLVEELQPERELSRNPLFQVMFALQNAPTAALRLPRLEIAPLEIDSGATVFDLTLLMAEEAGALTAALEYNADLFDASTAEAMMRHFHNLLRAIVARPDATLWTQALLDEAERHQIVVEWNDTAAAAELDRCIHHLIEEQVEKTPTAIAAVFAEQRLTYDGLNRRANQLAHYLRKLGVGPDSLVGICIDRSLEMVVALLAVVKAGGAAIALDPSYPLDRLEFMIRDAGGPVLLTEERLRKTLPESGVIQFCVDSQWSEVAHEPDSNLETPVVADNLLYGIYTSGSTGLPKGIGISHRAFLNLLEWQRRHATLGRKAKIVQFATFGFCVSFQEIFSAWCSGAEIALIAEDARRDVEAFADFLGEHQIERLYLPFASLKNLAEVFTSSRRLPPRLREFVTAGEQLQITAAVGEMFSSIGDGVLHNHYGASETHVVSAYTLAGPPGTWPAIPPSGRPITNVRIYLLDSRLQVVPVGVAGEVYIGGVCLARSYFNDAELTAEKFIPDPYSGRAGERLYRTGDLGRYLPDGNINYIGRADQQLKIRGFRVEPGEIEVTLRQHPLVRDAAVVAQADGAANKRLVAYLVWEAQSPGHINEVRNFLKSKLPDYMLPAAFVTLDALPMNANGKLDRPALPLAELSQARAGAGYSAPRTPTEEILAAIWAEVLGIGRVSRHENFFDAGGHSLLATQVMSRVREAFQIDLPLRRLFESPTPALLAEPVDLALGGRQLLDGPAIEAARCDEPRMMSFAQQRLWFFDRLKPGNPFYNIPTALLIEGRLDAAALAASLNEVVKRHEALRTTFAALDGRPTQFVAPATPVPLPVIDLRELAGPGRDLEVNRLILEEGQRPFDLRHGPLLRTQLLRVGDAAHVFLLVVHHIAFDGWSARIFVRELAALYKSFKGGEVANLPEPTLQYADFAHWQRQRMRRDVLAAHLDYWRRQLAGMATLALPTDYPRPETESFRGARQAFRLDRGLTDALIALSRRRNVTLFMLLLAAFDVLLSRYSGQEDIIVGTPIANRNRAEIEEIIGLFVNTLALRVNLGGDPRFSELLNRVRDTAFAAYAHQDLPFEKLVEELSPERDAGRHSVFQVMLVLHNTPVPPLQLDEVTLSPLDVETGTAKFDLMLSMMETAEGLNGSLEYNTDLFKPATISRMIDRFKTLAESIASDPEQRLSDLRMLNLAESGGLAAASFSAAGISRQELENLIVEIEEANESQHH